MQMVIVDDQPVLGEMLAKHVRDVAKAAGIDNVQITLFQNAEELLEDDNTYQMYLLDIELGKMSGIELGRRLRQQRIASPILFVSFYDDYVWETFLVGPNAYIRKDHMKEDLERNLTPLLYEFSGKKSVMLQCGSDRIKVYPEDIIYLQSVEHYIRIFETDCDKRRVLLRCRLGELEEQLLEHDFLRVHQRYLVNLRFCGGITKNEIQLTDGTVLPVSRRYKKRLQIAINRYLLR